MNIHEVLEQGYHLMSENIFKYSEIGLKLFFFDLGWALLTVCVKFLNKITF